MATTSNPGGESKPDAATIEIKHDAATAENKPAVPRSTAGKSTSTSRRRTQPPTPVEQAQAIAGRAVLVPIGASLVARDNLIGTVKGLATKYTTRSGLEREFKRYERRGVTERNRFEHQVRRTRSRLEREVQHRRSNVEMTVRENRRRFEREVQSVRKDLEKQGGAVSKRVDKLVSEAQGLIGNSAS